MRLMKNRPNRPCPIGCNCRHCRQMPHSGLAIEHRRDRSPRAMFWRAIFAAYAIAGTAALAFALLTWGAQT